MLVKATVSRVDMHVFHVGIGQQEKARMRQRQEELERANQAAAEEISSLKQLLEEQQGSNAALIQVTRAVCTLPVSR